MMTSNHITKVAVVGAGGNVGKCITEALLTTGKHTITAITRAESQTKLPEGVAVKEIDYNKPETLVVALRDQDALVITLSGHAGTETEMKLINAAGEAGVSWILPSDFTPDTTNEALVKDVVVFQPRVAIRKAITDLGKSSYISVITGFWYEYTLAMSAAFGIDFANRRATFFDDGKTKISVSTLPQVGRAVAALLSLPITTFFPAGEACISNFANKPVYINSFTVSQRNMLASAQRVTDTGEGDWTISNEPSHERYATGLKEIEEGKRLGWAKIMYTRLFYPDGCGDFEHNKSTINALLKLPKEDIDKATKEAIDRSRKPNYLGH